jgi:predicted ATPase
MRIKQLQIKGFKRFTDLTIQSIPETAKLIVLTGPNGSGKSSLFDALKVWHKVHGGHGTWEEEYHRKKGAAQTAWNKTVSMEFHGGTPTNANQRAKAIYVRSAYRNEPDFTIKRLTRMPHVLNSPNQSRLIDNDSIVSNNYQRVVSASVEGLYSGKHDTKTVEELRETFIGQIRTSMSNVFGDILLTGPGDPLTNGTFYFEKGTSQGFHYKNLSGGEKAAFDLILDLILKRADYNDTVYVIDEPEAHMHSRLQGRLLEELLELIPDTSQLWIATHSIGMMRKAKELYQEESEKVVFLDFADRDFDSTITIEPQDLDREFWMRSLGVALDDLASLVAPSQIVLCEGKLTDKPTSPRFEFDARCYRIIFKREFPDTDFLSGGNSHDIESDRLQLASSFQHLFSTMSVVRVLDQDNRSPQEVADLVDKGFRVLTQRHLEAYLLHDEIIHNLCTSSGQPEAVEQALEAKKVAIVNSVARDNPNDDIKSASGEIYTGLKTLLSLTRCGNNTESFLRDTMAPLLTPDTQAYKDLRKDIFGV